MENYNDSDYALNKYSEGIVYRFGDQTVTVTLKDYLTENLGKTEQDFRELKALSDKLYYAQDRADYTQTWKNLSINSIDDSRNFSEILFDEAYFEMLDREKAIATFVQLLESGKLTETQKRRFILHIIDGLPLREIAEYEGVFFTSVAESITTAIQKFRKIFEKI